MIKCSMIIVKEAVQHLNPGQVPVLAIHQPLFAMPLLSKSSVPGQIHWERTYVWWAAH